jgi:hypothetical protein
MIVSVFIWLNLTIYRDFSSIYGNLNPIYVKELLMKKLYTNTLVTEKIIFTVMSLLNIMKIDQAVQKLSMGDRQTRQTGDLLSSGYGPVAVSCE